MHGLVSDIIGGHWRCRRLLRLWYPSMDGGLPPDEKLLLSLPGIGTYSASAILAFAFNEPTVFIETNIRTVYTFFFATNAMSDRQILDIVGQTVDFVNPRDWYYALFDYGVMLKKWAFPGRKTQTAESAGPIYRGPTGRSGARY